MAFGVPCLRRRCKQPELQWNSSCRGPSAPNFIFCGLAKPLHTLGHSQPARLRALQTRCFCKRTRLRPSRTRCFAKTPHLRPSRTRCFAKTPHLRPLRTRCFANHLRLQSPPPKARKRLNASPALQTTPPAQAPNPHPPQTARRPVARWRRRARRGCGRCGGLLGPGRSRWLPGAARSGSVAARRAASSG